jgi:hypothetical protein
MTAHEKAERKFSREFWALEGQRRCIKAGQADRLFADDETKAFVLANIEDEQLRLIQALLEGFPGVYKQRPDGTWGLVDNNVIPLRPPSA